MRYDSRTLSGVPSDRSFRTSRAGCRGSTTDVSSTESSGCRAHHGATCRRALVLKPVRLHDRSRLHDAFHFHKQALDWRRIARQRSDTKLAEHHQRTDAGRPHDVEIVGWRQTAGAPVRHSFPHEIFEPGNQR